jgi:hypothetical protein
MNQNQTECEPTCAKCRHYVPYVNGKEEFIYGECRRNPPTMQRVPSISYRDSFPAIYEWVTNWPRLEQDDYCGCFDRKSGQSACASH